MNALMKAAYNIKVRNPSYRQESDISVQVAKIDLKHWFLVVCLRRRAKDAEDITSPVRNYALRQQSRIKYDVHDPFRELPSDLPQFHVDFLPTKDDGQRQDISE